MFERFNTSFKFERFIYPPTLREEIHNKAYFHRTNENHSRIG